MIKVKYNSETTLVIGNYPNHIHYPNIDIDTTNKTIDGQPYIDITQEEWENGLGKIMCVIDEVYQEYVKPDDVLLQEAKDNKISAIEANKTAFIYLPIEYNGSTFINSEKSSNALKITKDETDEPIEWLDINGVQVNLTKVEASELLLLMFTHRKSAYFQEASKITAVKNCTTIEEVEAVDINFN
jgi:hypothetical protein